MNTATARPLFWYTAWSLREATGMSALDVECAVGSGQIPETDLLNGEPGWTGANAMAVFRWSRANALRRKRPPRVTVPQLVELARVCETSVLEFARKRKILPLQQRGTFIGWTGNSARIMLAWARRIRNAHKCRR